MDENMLMIPLILLLSLSPNPTHVASAVPSKRSSNRIHTDDHGLYIKKTLPKVEPEPNSHYFELTKPLQSDHLTPSCTLSISLTTSARYFPPSDCSSAGWSHVALHIQASTSSRPNSCRPSDDDQPILPNLNSSNDVAALWLGGAELIRMSPPRPQSTELHGLGEFWEVRKDITRYSSLLAKSNITLTLTSLRSTKSGNESSSWVSPAAPYQANISILYFKYLDIVTVPAISGKTLQDGFYDEGPADLIIPLSNKSRDGGLSWFQIESEFDTRTVELEAPRNAMRAIMELYVSSHSEDEFWPSHMSRSMTRTTEKSSSKHRYGAFKEVFVTIDGKMVGSEVPFSVVFPGSINPFFWEPMVAIGAFDHPTYDIDLTPFLGSMIDGQTHEFGIGVSRSNPFWLVSGNLHLWLDHDRVQAPVVEAGLVLYHYPALRLEQKSEVKGYERRLQLKAKRKSKFTGWVRTSEGNLTTRVSQETEVKNSIRLGLTGQYIEIEHEIESEREARVESETGELVSLVTMKRKYSMTIATSILHRPDRSTYSGSANVTMKEKLVRGKTSRVYQNEQRASGWMTVTTREETSVVSGSGRTEQSLKYRDGVGGGGCCFREAAAEKGRLLKDESTYLCSAASLPASAL